MGVKMNFRIITKNHAADPEIGFLTKSISKPYGRATATPPAWKLTLSFMSYVIARFELFPGYRLKDLLDLRYRYLHHLPYFQRKTQPRD